LFSCNGLRYTSRTNTNTMAELQDKPAFVQLSSVGNPDFRQDPNSPLFGCETDKKKVISSLWEASEACGKFILSNDLGAGNWSGGEVTNKDGKIIARISYNGRAWTPESYPDFKPLDF
jgi:hypothetical protein